MGKLIAVISGSFKHLTLIKAGWRTHHTDGRLVYMVAPEPTTKGKE